MTSRTFVLAIAAVAVAAAGGLYLSGTDPMALLAKIGEQKQASKTARSKTLPAPAVSVTPATVADFVEAVIVTGTIVPREEILVVPEVEGLRVVALDVEEGQRVAKGHVMARLEREMLEAGVAQNAAQLSRADAAIAQAESAIKQAEARLAEAKAQFDRARPLRQSGFLADSTFDQREAAARTAEAQLVAARDGLKLASAEKEQIEAQRRETRFRLERTELRAPVGGIVSKRSARIGAVVGAANDPMFRIIADGEVELDGEVPETRIGKVKAGQPARVDVAGATEIPGTVRLVAPEVDRASRVGHVRIFIGENEKAKVGAFGRGAIETGRSRGLSLPASALVQSETGTTVQVVAGNKVETRRVETGLVTGGLVEITKGIAAGDLVVTRSGSFLRDGDTVRPVPPDARISDAQDKTDGTPQSEAQR